MQYSSVHVPTGLPHCSDWVLVADTSQQCAEAAVCSLMMTGSLNALLMALHIALALTVHTVVVLSVHMWAGHMLAVHTLAGYMLAVHKQAVHRQADLVQLAAAWQRYGCG